MKTCFATRAVLALVLTAASTLASAQIFEYDDADRYYEFVVADGISWTQANAAANASSHLGIQGHLATITSQAEEDFIRLHLPAAQGARTQWWLGGTKDNHCGSGCWGRWNHGGLEGNGGVILDHDNVVPPSEGFTRANPYTNWQTGQPDNSNNAQTVAYGPGADLFFGLDDNSRNNVIRGYVIEYGDSLTPQSAPLCQTPAGCNLTDGPVNGSVLKLPSTAMNVAGLYEVRTWLIDDEPGRCGMPDLPGIPEDDKGTQKLLDLLVDPDNEGPEVKVPGWTCANPDLGYFLVIKTDSSVTIPSGTVELENFTDNLLPISYQCHATFGRNDDPTKDDTGLFQYDQWEKMVEQEAFEAQYACGSGKLRGGAGSWWVAGVAINCGDGVHPYTCLLAVMQYKLKWAQLAVERAGTAPENVVAGGDLSKLRQELAVTVADLTNSKETEAKKHIQNFIKFARAATYNTSPSGTNWNGEFLMRGENLLRTINKLIAAEKFVAPQ